MSSLPALPKIEGDVDIVLDVYTHRSLRFQDAPMNDDYGDTERLAELGARVLDLAVTSHYYSKKPMLKAAEITEKREQALAADKLESWLESYGLRHKLRFAQEAKDDIGTPEEIRRFFHTYVGALHIRNGMPTIQEWISRLIDPDAEPDIPSFPAQGPDTFSMQQPWNPPSQPPSSPPPLPSFPPPPPPSVVPNLVSLALVNQTASQRGVAVSYSAEQTGPAHLPIWTVRCLMNGVERGRGQGKSQKLAKEEAARQAWCNMGW